jgi:hypothetical protein
MVPPKRTLGARVGYQESTYDMQNSPLTKLIKQRLNHEQFPIIDKQSCTYVRGKLNVVVQSIPGMPGVTILGFFGPLMWDARKEFWNDLND